MSPLLQHELDDDRRYHPNLGGITRGGLANHYPMTMLALDGLGATDAELQAFRQHWGRHRASIDADLRLADRGVVTTDDWPAYLGQPERLPEFRRVFETLLAESPADDVVASALWTLRDGLPMGLFHPLIRLSFACARERKGLIADALAYAAIRYADLYRAPALTTGTGSLEPADVWERIATNEDVVPELPAGASLRVCEQLCADEGLHRAALPAGLELSPESLDARVPQICRLALRLYLFEPALTTLHAVTAAQALAELTQRATNARARATYAALWTRYWIWLTGLYIEKGRPTALPVATGAPVHDGWPALAAQSRAIPEVHLIKLAYSLRWLDETFGPDPLYALAVVNMLREGVAHPRHGEGWVLGALR